MALALYRKYRPRNLSDLMGHEANVSILRNAAADGSLGQAYLFYGPRGTGKTSTARLLAKLLNCERRATDEKFRKKGEPCNECAACNEIENLSSFDVIEIDAASNRGIEEIRNLKESIKAAPTGGRTKVYIIDEAHMLTGPAFNALLKTLEEPPRHAVFVLATTEFEKLPPTITSRTQRFLFRKLGKKDILAKLKKIVEAEDISADEDALELIAAAAEGSLRDAESLLDQLSSLEDRIDLGSAERIIGRTGFQKVERLAELILKKDAKEALAFIETVNEEGLNLIQMTKDLIHYLRKIMTLSLNPETEPLFSGDLTKEEMVRLRQFSASAKPETLTPIIRALIRAYGEMRYSPFAIVPLEVALVEELSK